MKAHCLAVVLGALALIAQTGFALAQGKLTGVVTNPFPPNINTCVPLMIKVNGTGQCYNLDIAWGDGTHTIALSRRGHLITFPVTFTHPKGYSQPGTHHVQVSATKYSECTGVVGALVQVTGPQITGLSLFENITPGGAVIVTGQNFGPIKGQMLLHLNYMNKFAQDVPLTVTNWGDGFAAGTIPGSGDSVSGALDQDTTVKVIASCGAASNDFKVHFTAATDVVDLAYADPPAGHPAPWITCAMSSGVSGSDQCQTQGDSNYPPECATGFPDWGLAGGAGTLGGYHASGWGFTGDSGSDQFVALSPLLNGWTVNATSADWTMQVGNGGNVNLDQGQSAQNGATTPTVGVQYHINNCGAMFYMGHIFIIGPLGVPY